MKTYTLKRIISAFAVVFVLALSLVLPVTVFADANIGMTTSTGIVDISDNFVVNVEITADEQIGTYYIELEYDSSRMRYTGGAESEQDGILTLTGTGLSRQIKYDLKFSGARGGEAGIVVRSSIINNSSGSEIYTADSGILEIIVTGQSDSAASFVQKLAEEQELLQSDLPIAGSIHDASGNTLYVVDLNRTTPDIMDFAFDTVEDTFEGQTVTFATDKDGILKIIPLMDSEDNVRLYAVNGDSFYPVVEHSDSKGNKYVYTTLEACPQMPQKLASTTEMWEYVVFAINKDGEGGFYLMDGKGDLSLYTVLNSSGVVVSTGWLANIFTGSAIPWETYLKLAALVIVAVIAIVIILTILVKILKKNRMMRAVEYAGSFDDDESGRIDEDIDDVDVVRKAAEVESDIEKEPKSRRVRAEAPTGKKVSRVNDLNVNVVERTEKAEEEAIDAPSEDPDDKDLIDLDDIVLSPEEILVEREMESASEKIKTGTISIAPSEPESKPELVAKTIRFGDDILEDIADEGSNDDDIDDIIGNIEL